MYLFQSMHQIPLAGAFHFDNSAEAAIAVEIKSQVIRPQNVFLDDWKRLIIDVYQQANTRFSLLPGDANPDAALRRHG